jgi:hypothetical protein
LGTFLESNHENILRSAKQMRNLLGRWIKKELI